MFEMTVWCRHEGCLAACLTDRLSFQESTLKIQWLMTKKLNSPRPNVVNHPKEAEYH